MLENCNYAIMGWAGMFYLAIGSLDRRRGGDGKELYVAHALYIEEEGGMTSYDSRTSSSILRDCGSSNPESCFRQIRKKAKSKN